MKRIIMFLVTLSSVFAIAFNNIESSLNDDLQKAMGILSEQISLDEKSNKLFNVFDKYFDYALMAKLSLGKLHDKLNNEQKEQFGKLFEQRLKKSFSEKLSHYTKEKVSIAKIERPNDKRVFVRSVVTSQKGDNYDLVFKFSLHDNNDFLIYDVDIIGVSLIKTYRAQFEDLGSNTDFNEILKRLDNTKSFD